MAYGFVYMTTNSINGKIYIGQRVYKNTPADASYLGSGSVLFKAIKKYGKDKFTRIILEECCDSHTLDECEKKYISEYNSTDKSIGYNIRKGGKGYESHTPKTCNKISEGLKLYFSIPENREKNKRPVSDETRKKISDAGRGRKKTPEEIQKQKDTFYKNRANGKKQNRDFDTPEWRENFRKSHIGKTHTTEYMTEEWLKEQSEKQIAAIKPKYQIDVYKDGILLSENLSANLVIKKYKFSSGWFQDRLNKQIDKFEYRGYEIVIKQRP